MLRGDFKLFSVKEGIHFNKRDTYILIVSSKLIIIRKYYKINLFSWVSAGVCSFRKTIHHFHSKEKWKQREMKTEKKIVHGQ